jgi:uncharacterized membrane protein
MLIVMRLFFLVGLMSSMFFYLMHLRRGEARYKKLSLYSLVTTLLFLLLFFVGLVIENQLYPPVP